MTSTYHHVLLVMHRFKIPLILAAAVMLAFSAFALEAIEHDPKFTTVAQRFQADFGVSLKLAQVDDAFFAKNHVVSPLKPEHLDYALQITARKLLLRGPGRVGIGCGAETGCEGVWGERGAGK